MNYRERVFTSFLRLTDTGRDPYTEQVAREEEEESPSSPRPSPPHPKMDFCTGEFATKIEDQPLAFASSSPSSPGDADALVKATTRHVLKTSDGGLLNVNVTLRKVDIGNLAHQAFHATADNFYGISLYDRNRPHVELLQEFSGKVGPQVLPSLMKGFVVLVFPLFSGQMALCHLRSPSLYS